MIRNLLMMAVVLLAVGCCSHDAALTRAEDSATRLRAISLKDTEAPKTKEVATVAADAIEALIYEIDPDRKPSEGARERAGVEEPTDGGDQ